jgi:hypothetical protein
MQESYVKSDNYKIKLLAEKTIEYYEKASKGKMSGEEYLRWGLSPEGNIYGECYCQRGSPFSGYEPFSRYPL